jgi:mono/diheme cytochrome c family protein
MRARQFLDVAFLTLVACRTTPPASQPATGSTAAANPTQQQSLDRSDQLLLAAAKVALPPPGVAAGDLPDPTSQGALLLMQYCAQCHSVPAPTAHSATDWPSVARRMWLRMEWLPASLGVQVPTAAQRYTILSYLLANSLKVSGTVLPAGKGRDEFSAVCSQCHSLPDPRVHSPQDWPAVYSRMERNMERMQVQPPSATLTGDILLYLQGVGGRRPATRN